MLNKFEWPTIGVLVLTYALWIFTTVMLAEWSLTLAIIATGILITQHSSLQHEALHGHPTPYPAMNTLLVYPALSLFIPYHRFRDTHLAHHHDCALTDPFDDPETNFLTQQKWDALSPICRLIMTFNNTLLGRVMIGGIIGTGQFLWSEIKSVHKPDVRRGWLWHVPAVFMVIAWIGITPMPLWAYTLSALIGLSLLRIRTFLEHRAHDHQSARSVVIEDRGPLSVLFLNNNYHALHHAQPGVAWYKLPALYLKDREKILSENDGYRYENYGQIFRQHLLRPKDPVAHPLWHKD